MLLILIRLLQFSFWFIFTGLVDCDYYKTDDYNYTKFVDLKTVKDAQPEGYYARVPVYLIGPRDAHVVLSPIDSSAALFVYEFGMDSLGGFITPIFNAGQPIRFLCQKHLFIFQFELSIFFLFCSKF